MMLDLPFFPAFGYGSEQKVFVFAIFSRVHYLNNLKR
jgi:hypothetical protein